jgi:hypothetical protein
MEKNKETKDSFDKENHKRSAVQSEVMARGTSYAELAIVNPSEVAEPHHDSWISANGKTIKSAGRT